MAPLTLFYSYADEDQVLRDQLERHLGQLRRGRMISEWHDHKILPGGTRADEIDTHLETASIILLLVSPDFLASDYYYENEMQRALARHERGEARVIPIILRPCDWQHTPLKDLQCLPRNGQPVTQWSDQDEVFNAITQSLRRIIERRQALAHPPVPLTPLNRQNRIRMLRQVRAIWIDGFLTQSLHQAVRVELSLQDRPDVLANPWRLQVQELHQAPQKLPDGTSIVQVYDSADGELIILGEPGSGKTTLLLELARTLLERAEQDEQLPMPIVFHLSSWAEKRQPLRTWLVEELATKYQVPRKIGQSWIDADQVLPLLDGLDEVAREARSACVEQINDYYQSRLEHGSSPIVVCCRSEEYAALSTGIMLQHAVSILPLTDEQINTYLEQAGEQVAALKEALHEDTELHSLARQPLMLSIFVFAYRGALAEEVPTGKTREELQRTIFARYVEHMLKRRGLSRRWKPEQVTRWLAFLARQMWIHEQTVFYVESLQPTWLSSMGWDILYRCAVGLGCGLIYGLIWWPIGELIGIPILGLVGGLIAGSLFALVVDIDPVEVFTWSWKEIPPWLAIGASVGIFLGLLDGVVEGVLNGVSYGLASGLSVGLDSELLHGLPAALLSGFILGLVGGLSVRQVPDRSSLSPNEGIWRSGKNGLISGLAFGCITGLILFPIFGTMTRTLDLPIVGLAFVLWVTLVTGPLIGWIRGLSAFVLHFILRLFLSWRGDLPRDLVAFLDEAAQRLLLRKVGGSYVFVHRLLLEYFAEMKEHED